MKLSDNAKITKSKFSLHIHFKLLHKHCTSKTYIHCIFALSLLVLFSLSWFFISVDDPSCMSAQFTVNHHKKMGKKSVNKRNDRTCKMDLNAKFDLSFK